ncbi:tubby C-terminal domain-like protein [Staphylococcus caprae]|uniref:tubby C-terminal domain-like protein n=1 Tax=Staphylococcus caprae TaxID=29380 RepID=UPI003BB75560
MYKYFKRNRFSTKSSDIKGNSDKHIGTIQKKYSNVFQRSSLWALNLINSRFMITNNI